METVLKEFRYPCSDGESFIYARKWEGSDTPSFVVLMAHGLHEHISLYDELGEHLAEAGAVAYGADMAGHGLSVDLYGAFGHFGDTHGVDNLIGDIATLQAYIAQQYPGVPLFLVGQGFGSLLLRCHGAGNRDGDGWGQVKGIALIGTPGPGLPANRAKMIAATQSMGGNDRKPGTKVVELVTSGFLDKVENPAWAREWVTRDADWLDELKADPYCIFEYTYQACGDIAKIYSDASGNKWAASMPKKTPVLLLSGENDPVAGYAAGAKKTGQALTRAGVEDVRLVVYPGARHALVVEENRAEVFADLASWMKSRI
jgi:alpha-beta hydrolase superfamily lysophospholipase